MSLEVPSDDELLRIYANPEQDDGSSYAGWAALWLSGYREGALVRPNVETRRELDVVSAWRDYGKFAPTPENYELFAAGYLYGQRAVSPKYPGWMPPVVAAVAFASAVAGGIVSAVLF